MSEGEIHQDCIVAVIGAGAMGAGIAQVAAQAGHRVLLHDARDGAAEAAIETIGRQLARRVEQGKSSAESREKILQCLQPAKDLADIHQAGLVVEAIVEKLDVKQKLLSSIESVVADDAILATNTSSISITSIGAALRRPQRLLGLHFFNPATVMPLVEVISGAATSTDVAQRVHDLAQRWGKTPVLAQSTPGFIVNRVARPYYAEALRLLQEGAASVATIDAVMRVCGGFRMGPFELMDLIGHDVNYAVTCSVFDAYYGDPRFAPSLIQLELVNAGFLGRKSGRGFYAYGEGVTPQEPQRESQLSAPQDMVINPTHPIGLALANRLTAAGCSFSFRQQDAGADEVARVGDAVLVVTDGRTASHRSVVNRTPNLVVMDLLLNPDRASGAALAYSARCSAEARRAVTGLLQAAGLEVYPMADSPGLAVMRTVAMLANEACDAVHQGVCTAEAVDVAMCNGVNYPLGPIAWAERLGADVVLEALDHLHDHYREPRYRASPRLRNMQWTEGNLYG